MKYNLTRFSNAKISIALITLLCALPACDNTGTNPNAAAPNEEAGIPVRQLIIKRADFKLDDVTITAQPTITEVTPGKPEWQPKPGHKLVMLDVEFTTQQKEVIISPTRYALSSGQAVIPLWGTQDLDPYGVSEPRKKIVIPLTMGVSTSTFYKLGAKHTLGLIFMIEQTVDPLDLRLIRLKPEEKPK